LQPITKERHDYSTGAIVEEFLNLCHDPLRDLPRWLDTQGRKRSHGDRLLARQGAGLVRNDGLRQVRASESGQHLTEGDDGEAISVEAEISLLRAFFGAAIAAVRRDVPKNDRAAANKALRQRLKAAILAVTERRRQATANRRAARRSQRARTPKPDK